MSELQRNSKSIVDRVKESATPYYVVRNNKPEMVMVSIDEYENLKKIRREWEEDDVLRIIKRI